MSYHGNPSSIPMSPTGNVVMDLGRMIPPIPPPTTPSHSKCSDCFRFLRQTTSFLLSHIGLFSLVVGYCLLGGLIFEELEKENELMVKRNMTKTREAVTKDLWAMTEDMEVLIQEDWTKSVTSHLRNFEKSLIIALKEKGWDGSENEESVTWTFSGGLFYSITVITTIGYGHIAPKTPIAKIVTIFYAILGIPLTVLCWSNIGDAMANAFRFSYWRICCFVCTKNDKKRQRRRAAARPKVVASNRFPSRSLSIRRSQRTSQRSADSALSVESSTSYSIYNNEEKTPVSYEEDVGDIGRPGMNRNRSSIKTSKNTTFEYPEENPPISSMSKPPAPDLALTTPPSKNLSGNKFTRGLSLTRKKPPPLQIQTQTGLPEPTSCTTTNKNINRSNRTPPGAQVPQKTPLGRVPEDDWMSITADPFLEEYEFILEEEDFDDYSRKPVPIWLSICLVIAYILFGAYIFKAWEGWTLLDSSYFCFITLTTIGFGDLVPDQRTEDGEKRIALCSLYLLFGIAMIAMSFNLVQEEVINHFKDLGRKLGIIKDDEDNEDY
ncbi:potassium channel subfamily K member 18 [Lepeophtheirus salmonis]|uniref:potassium channel subfamily K member 18 n=1 Tax=Lepeophtheirus salmonis TaxID=72036 RepID=UPI001AE825C4|nr:TWiK family of potassium channels protein 7-like [Lepeophtheirus salmonis]